MRRQIHVLAVLLVLVMASVAGAQQQPAPTTQPAQSQAAPPQTPAVSQSPNTTGSAEHPTFEVGLGYQFLRAGGLCFGDDDDDLDGNGDDDCGDSRSFPLGFAIDGVRNFGAVGLVAELGWSRDSEDFSFDGDSVTVSDNLFTYGAGVRVTGHGAGRFWPYGQILVGGVTSRVSAEFDDDSESESRTRFMVQPGVGATVVAGDGWGIFGQVDYRRIFLDEEEDGSSGRNDIRVFVGFRWILD